MVAGSEPRVMGDALPMLIEGILFVADEPVVISDLAAVLEVTPRAIRAGLEELAERLRGRGVRLQRMGDAVHLVSAPEAGAVIERFLGSEGSQRLSTAALEALAVIAYRQPVTSLEITEIRGVNTAGVLNTLLERHLIKIVGRKPVVGRPFMYATTKEFLIRFGLNDLNDLPNVEDMAEALGIEAPLLVEREPNDDQLPLEEPEIELGGTDDDPGGSVH